MSSVPAGIPFSQVLCHLCKMRICVGANPCHFGQQSQLFIKIPYPTIHSSLSHARLFSPRISLTGHRWLHRGSVSPLHCALSIHLFYRSQCASQLTPLSPASNTRPPFHSHSHFIVPSCDVLRRVGQRVYSPCSDNEIWPIQKCV